MATANRNVGRRVPRRTFHASTPNTTVATAVNMSRLIDWSRNSLSDWLAAERHIAAEISCGFSSYGKLSELCAWASNMISTSAIPAGAGESIKAAAFLILLGMASM
ncbi:hypothetical protein [Nonomuraea sp. LPB2021202275-12-8]|uniref:hypothetical protein n=1 Tax=Nonomuraea sp. LPB2021202275-12-8 TaxID=3120159 RepID=UPI003FA583E5